jgi:dihydroorotase
MLSNEQFILLSISETWRSFEVLRVILERITDGKTVRKLKEGNHSFCMMAYWIYLMHIGIFEIEKFME